MHRRGIMDDIKDAGDKMKDKIDGVGDSLQETEDYIRCALGQEPTFMQMIDFDKDCNRVIEVQVGDTNLSFDALWLWGVIIGLLLGFCLCGVLCSRR